MDLFGASYPWAEYSVFSQLLNVGTKTLGITAGSFGSGLEISSLSLLSLLLNRPLAWMAHGSSNVFAFVKLKFGRVIQARKASACDAQVVG